MKYGKWGSAIITVSSGLPQSSPLSVVLFNVYTYTIIDIQQEARAYSFTYVDDIIVESVDYTPEEGVAKQQEASNVLCLWIQDNT
jgi:hypothetical protein